MDYSSVHNSLHSTSVTCKTSIKVGGRGQEGSSGHSTSGSLFCNSMVSAPSLNFLMLCCCLQKLLLENKIWSAPENPLLFGNPLPGLPYNACYQPARYTYSGMPAIVRVSSCTVSLICRCSRAR